MKKVLKIGMVFMSFKINNNLTINLVEVIEEFEGPILAKYISNTNDIYIGHILTTCQLGDLFIISKSSNEEIEKYKKKELSMRHLVKSDIPDTHCWVLAISNNQVMCVIETNIKSLPSSYQPSNDAFYDEDLAPYSA